MAVILVKLLVTLWIREGRVNPDMIASFEVRENPALTGRHEKLHRTSITLHFNNAVDASNFVYTCSSPIPRNTRWREGHAVWFFGDQPWVRIGLEHGPTYNPAATVRMWPHRCHSPENIDIILSGL